MARTRSASTPAPTKAPRKASAATVAGSPRFGAADYASAKASAVGQLIAVGEHNQPVWTRRRFDAFALEAYILNVVSSRCVSLKANCFASLALMVMTGKTKQDAHPVLSLLDQPNPMQGRQRLLKAIWSFGEIAGNAYLEAVTASGKPRELWCLRPDRVMILESRTGIPAGYRYETGRGKFDFPCDPITGVSDILHLRQFHPLDDWYGLAPTEPAARSIDQFNAAAAHNASLLQKGVRPSGFLALKTASTREQIAAAESIVAEKWAGTDNAGKVQILAGDWQWISAGQTLKDMDFYEGTQQKAREICAAYGVPHVLIVPGEATYSNRDSAYLELYEATILPEADVVLGDLERWMRQWFPGRWRLTYDKDQIWALTPRRTEFRKQAVLEWEKGLITRDEAREALQYDPAPSDGDAYATDSPIGMDGGMDPLTGKPRPPTPGRKPPALALVKPGAKPAAAPAKASGGPDERKAVDPNEVASDVPDEAMTAEVLPVVRTVVAAYGEQVFAELAIEGSFDLVDPNVVKFLEEYGATRIKELVGTTTRDQLAKTLAEGVNGGDSTAKLMARIREVFTRATKERAKMIAETEVTIASGLGTQTALVESGTQFKVWLSTSDSNTRETHAKMDAQIQPVTEPFVSTSGDRGQYPGGFSTAAENIYCRCSSGVFIPGIDGPLPEALRERFNLTEDGEPAEAGKSRSGRRSTKSLKLRRAARDKLRARYVAELTAAIERGFVKQEAYVVRRFRRLALLAGQPVAEEVAA